MELDAAQLAPDLMVAELLADAAAIALFAHATGHAQNPGRMRMAARALARCFGTLSVAATLNSLDQREAARLSLAFRRASDAPQHRMERMVLWFSQKAVLFTYDVAGVASPTMLGTRCRNAQLFGNSL